MDYKRIKTIARARGLSVIDLLALAPANDPFYVGSKGEVIKGKWFADIYAMMGSPANCHIRRVHYWLVTTKRAAKPNGEPYENTDNDWNLLTQAAKYARYLGLVPIAAIVDRRNPPPAVNAHHWKHRSASNIVGEIDESSIIESIVDQFYPFNPCRTQAYMLETWAEKSTMNDVLLPICQRYGMNLVTGLGEISITAVYQLALRIKEAGKPTRIFYVSDFDPAGECMPVSAARKIEYFMRTYDIDQDVKLIPLVLTPQQCKDYDLPRAPIKRPKNDDPSYTTRTEKFQDRHGVGATELDAMEAIHPGELARIIEDAIEPYFDREKWNAAIRKNQELQKEVKEYLIGRECEQCEGTGTYSWQDRDGKSYTETCLGCSGAGKVAGRIGENVMGDLDVSTFDTWMPPEPTTVADENSSHFVYDSNLDYVSQIERYREQQQQESLSGSDDDRTMKPENNSNDLEEI